MPELLCCTPKLLPPHLHVEAAAEAIDQNPANAPHPSLTHTLSPQRLALLTTKWWGAGGVHLTVSFLESTDPALAAKILEHMNAWGQWANTVFTLVPSGGQVRITLKGDGYWSFLGTDIQQIPSGEPTMSLQDFSLSTPDSEYRRVVRHETGHTLGFVHEHLRGPIIALLDPEKTIAYGAQAWGWDRQTVIDQVLTPVPESQLTATPLADQMSIMAYQLPGACTKSGQPIAGGTDIDTTDQGLVAKLYPSSNGGGGDGAVPSRLQLLQPMPAGATPLYDAKKKKVATFRGADHATPKGVYTLGTEGA